MTNYSKTTNAHPNTRWHNAFYYYAIEYENTPKDDAHQARRDELLGHMKDLDMARISRPVARKRGKQVAAKRKEKEPKYVKNAGALAAMEQFKKKENKEI